MAQTVVGFFDNQSEAQRAVERLEQCGITRDRIDVSNGNSGTTNVDYDRTESREKESGITRFFKSLFGDDDDEATRYSRVAERSQAIVTVHARSNDEAEQAADILDDCGAVDVDERDTEYRSTSAGRTDTDLRSRENLGREDIGREQETRIPRIQENLEVGKRTEERGNVRVRSRIVERPVEEHIRLREEHVNVEREAVNRPVSGDELSNFQERDIELTERAEVPVVNKEARVVEEVRVSKNVETHDETVRDTVRNTEIDVDKNDTTNRTGRRTDPDSRDDNSLRGDRGL